jgi:hypothetical protein
MMVAPFGRALFRHADYLGLYKSLVNLTFGDMEMRKSDNPRFVYNFRLRVFQSSGFGRLIFKGRCHAADTF